MKLKELGEQSSSSWTRCVLFSDAAVRRFQNAPWLYYSTLNTTAYVPSIKAKKGFYQPCLYMMKDIFRSGTASVPIKSLKIQNTSSRASTKLAVYYISRYDRCSVVFLDDLYISDVFEFKILQYPTALLCMLQVDSSMSPAACR